jgi:hypothetical protein
MAKQKSMAAQADVAVAEAAEWGVTLDFSEGNAEAVERFLIAVERTCRTANDLPNNARVGELVSGMIDLDALGAYYGELFVRHAGASWGSEEGENGPQPAVIRGTVTVPPIEVVRTRVFSGSVDLVNLFKSEKKAMSRQRVKAEPGATTHGGA